MKNNENKVKTSLAYLMIGLTTCQALQPVFAAGITIRDNRTQITTKNGVPVINIAGHNRSRGDGVSHNRFGEFNVDTNGLVFNNATVAQTSQLAGALAKNPNLNGNPAKIIVAEVLGSRPSNLQGKIEVHGNKSDVMIANPNGITCDGCGFINTPKVTLTTGNLFLNAYTGVPSSLSVRRGVVTIGPKGIDARNQDYLEIISRAVDIQGKIQAKDLSFIQGASHVSYHNGTVRDFSQDFDVQRTPIPALAIDTKALGGMYADRIRMHITDKGAGVNLANVTATQGDVRLLADGHVKLENISAKNDVSILGSKIAVPLGKTVQAGGNLSLMAESINNYGKIIAGKNMHLFGDNVTNIKGVIQANNTLYIQKNANSERGQSLKNISGTIKTLTGDLLIRQDKVENIRESVTGQWQTAAVANSTSVDHYLGSSFIYKEGQFPSGNAFFANISAIGFNKWFDHIDLKISGDVNTARKSYRLINNSAQSVIQAGKNLYINSDTLRNHASTIASAQDMFLTGGSLLSENIQFGREYTYHQLAPVTTAHLKTPLYTAVDLPLFPVDVKKFPRANVAYKTSAVKKVWFADQELASHIQAGGNLVADYQRNITLKNSVDSKNYHEIIVGNSLAAQRGNTLSGSTIILKADNIIGFGNINAATALSAITTNQIYLSDAVLRAPQAINLLAGSHMILPQVSLLANNITLLARTGNLHLATNSGAMIGANTAKFFNANYVRKLAEFKPVVKVDIQAGGSVTFNNVDLNANPVRESYSILSGQDIEFARNNDLFVPSLLQSASHAYQKDKAKQRAQFEQNLAIPFNVAANKSVTLRAGRDLHLNGASILTQLGELTLVAGKDIFLAPRILPAALKAAFFLPTREALLSATVNSGSSLLITAGAHFNATAATLNSRNNMDLVIGGNVNLGAVKTRAVNGENPKREVHLVTRFNAGGKLNLVADGTLQAAGSVFSSGSDMFLNTTGNMSFKSLVNHAYTEANNETRSEYTHQVSTLNSKAGLTLASSGSILFQASKLLATHSMDVAAKGGVLFAQAMNETRFQQTREKKNLLLGIITKEVIKTRNESTYKPVEFIAGGDIHLLSRDDSTYQASKISAGKNAKLTSTKGKVVFEGVKDSYFYQKLQTSKGFFIKQNNQGYQKDIWKLPVVHTGGKLFIEAANGINAEIKAGRDKTLHDVIDVVGRQPGTEWVRLLANRQDVNWNMVRDVYSSWNETQTGLSPVGAALVALAVGIVTAGTGLAANAGYALSGTTAGAPMTAAQSILYGMGSSGMSTLTTKAAVALIGSQGNLSQAFKELTNSHAVRDLVSSMLVGGALTGLDAIAWGVTPTPSSAQLPQLTNGQWGNAAMRLVGQSVIKSGINSAIYHSNFKDLLVDSLLYDFSSLAQAEGANYIGGFGHVLGVPGKALSHAVLAGVTAEIGKGNGKGAIAGAFAAELAGISLGDTFKQLNYNTDVQASVIKFIGGLAGAVATNNPAGVNSAAHAAEMVDRYNRLLHDNETKWIQERSGDEKLDIYLVAAACAKVKCSAGFKSGTEIYRQYSELEKLGNSPELATVRALLEKYGGAEMFTYGILDRFKDTNSQYGVIDRTLGGLQAVAGVATTITASTAGTVTCAASLGLGCIMTGLLFGAGLDYTYAGAKTLYFGDYQNPYGEQLLQKVGVPAGTSGWLYDAMMLGGIGLAATQIAKLGTEAAYLTGKGALNYVDEPLFNPVGTGGAAKPWSIKGRINHVQLPTEGKIRFIPDSNYSASNPLPRGPNNGYLDKFGNEWTKGPSRTPGQTFEWDVQLSPKGKAQLGWATKDGSHLNISLDGKITHK